MWQWKGIIYWNYEIKICRFLFVSWNYWTFSPTRLRDITTRKRERERSGRHFRYKLHNIHVGLNDIGSHFKLTLKICIYDRIYWFHAEQKRPQNKIVIDFFLGVEILIKTWNLISFMKLILNFFRKILLFKQFPFECAFYRI